MGRALWAGVVLMLALACGCTSGPLLDNPSLVVPGADGPCEDNPVYVALGPEAYGKVFDCVLSVLHDSGFQVLESNRYDGSVETLPTSAPGVLEPFRPGSPVLAERFLATAQTYRHRARVKIQPADNGGFFIHVTVLKELEDLPRPVRSTAGGALFRSDNNVDRRVELVDPTLFEANWIPKGRDIYYEEAILRRLKGCL